MMRRDHPPGEDNSPEKQIDRELRRLECVMRGSDVIAILARCFDVRAVVEKLTLYGWTTDEMRHRAADAVRMGKQKADSLRGAK